MRTAIRPVFVGAYVGAMIVVLFAGSIAFAACIITALGWLAGGPSPSPWPFVALAALYTVFATAERMTDPKGTRLEDK